MDFVKWEYATQRRWQIRLGGYLLTLKEDAVFASARCERLGFALDFKRSSTDEAKNIAMRRFYEFVKEMEAEIIKCANETWEILNVGKDESEV